MKIHRLYRLGPLAAATLLAGCMNLQPRYERPAAPVAASFPSAASVPAGPAGTERPWQAYFADPRLRALIEIALRNNRDLRIAVLNIQATRAQLGLRRADEWPTVSAGASATRQPASGSNGGTSSLYTAGLAVSAWELDLFGRLRSLSDAAAAQLLASEEARKAAQIALVAAVASQALALAADEEMLGLTRETLATRQETLRLTRLRFEHGAASELDLRLAQTLAESGRAALAQAQRQRALDENALVLLLGQPLPAGLPGPGDWAGLDLADVPAGLPSEALLQRPDVRQAEQQLIAAQASIGAARAAFWPRITLTASLGTASSELSSLFSKAAWSFAPQLLQPLFDAGRNRAGLAQVEAQRDIAIAQYERAIQAAFRDVADALAGRATLNEQFDATVAQAEAEQARLKLVELRLEHGAASALEGLDAQRSAFAARQALVQTRLALLLNRVAVYRALGGGWSEAVR